MARKPKNVAQDGLLYEIDEEVRHERYQKLWDRFKYYVIGGVALLVLSVSGYQIWTYTETSKREQSTMRFFAVQSLYEQEKQEEAKKAIATALENKTLYHLELLGRFEEASFYSDSGDFLEAARYYEIISQDKNVEEDWRFLAAYFSALHYLNIEELEKVDMLLEPLLNQRMRPIYYLAEELRAIAALQRDEKAKAYSIFSEMNEDILLPSTIRQQNIVMRTILEEFAEKEEENTSEDIFTEKREEEESIQENSFQNEEDES